ncbi:hypothetical protein ACTWP4_07170 [Gracilibacillus sp. D59]|uniref:hypothetical protein n=1 Tax=Gracilibacillus sp. D59 TaxID=3457434 RepID=UPI003FCE1453
MRENKCILGVVTPPLYTEKIGRQLKKGLPALLNEYTEDNIKWEIEYISDPLTGLTEHSKDVIEALCEKKEEKEWDFAVCLTDLPLFRHKRLVVAEANKERKVSLLSLPALGAFPLIKRIQISILHLVKEMYGDNIEMKGSPNNRTKWWKEFTLLPPIQKEVAEKNETHIGVRFTMDSKFRGGLRMISGMVKANRPWLLFPSFFKILIIAFTTGVYALIFPTMWKLSHGYELSRMMLVSVIAIAALVFWIIAAHNLWEKPSDGYSDYLRKLYNGTTVLTLLMTVVLYYCLLYICFFIAVFLLIPIEMLESQLSGPTGFGNYFKIAWVATSVSTIIGALGSTLEKEEVVLSGTYGYRQRQRYKLMKEAAEKKRKAAHEKKEIAQGK